ncbi:MAG: hypothetical protein ACRBBW_20935 [Cellvibrionaceae bacterium]
MNKLEVDMDTLCTFVSGMTVDGKRLHEDHYVFDNITPYQAFLVGVQLGFDQCVAANDE